MTPAQEKFVELEKKKEEVKKYFKDLADALQVVMSEIGVEGYFMDDDKVVYKIIIPEGKFVQYEKLSYVRTKRDGETRGSLSVKEAEENGFKIK